MIKFSLFGFALLVSFFSYWPVRYIGKRFKILDHPDYARKIHKTPVLRTGGIQIFFAFLVTYFLFKPLLSFYLSLIILFFIFLVGAVEDKFFIPFRWRLLFLILISFIFIPSGLLVTHVEILQFPFFISVIFTIFCFLGITNAFNFIDGINGLSSGLGIVSLIFLFIFSIHFGDANLSVFILIGIASISGFFIHNFSFKNVFMGDSGSYFVGGFFAVSSLLLLNGSHKVSPWSILLLGFIPVFDTIFSIYRRKKKGKGIFKADRMHLHHRLLKRYNNNSRKVVFILLGVQGCICLIAYFFNRNTAFLILFSFFCLIFLRRLWFGPIRLGTSKYAIKI